MLASVFNDRTLRATLTGLDRNWVQAADRTVLDVVDALYGDHVCVKEHRYAGHIRVYVSTCLSTHRAFFVDTSHWDTHVDRVSLLDMSVRSYDEATNLLTLAAGFAEPGYLQRKESGSCAPADLFVIALIRDWHDSRALAGDDWTVASAATFAGLVSADPVIPYLGDAIVDPR